MNKNNTHAILWRFIFFTICIIFLFTGCEKQSESQKKQKVASKKIVMTQKDEVKSDAGSKSVADKNEASLPTSPDGPASSEAKESEPVQEKIAALGEKIKSDEKQKPIDKPPVVINMNEIPVAYAYNPVGKIDPFATIFKEQPEVTTQEVTKTGVKKRIPLTPLEKISISQLKLAAVMLAPSGDRALVEEASGKGYVITQGTYIGINSGRVVDILMDRIIVEEMGQDLLGKSVVKRTEMMLQKTPGE